VESGESRGIVFRLVGGVAVRLRCPSSAVPPLARSFHDVDLVGLGEQRRTIQHFMGDIGYQADEKLNVLHGRTRLFFWDPGHRREVDVFLDAFEMCHIVELGSRLRVDRFTISLADMLLTKLQVFQTDEKDYKDIIAILLDHELTTDDETGINVQRITSLARNDWGLWRTLTDVLGRAQDYARTLPLPLPGTHAIEDQVRALLQSLHQVPKSVRWRLRSWVGDRVRWYQLPEATAWEMERNP